MNSGDRDLIEFHRHEFSKESQKEESFWLEEKQLVSSHLPPPRPSPPARKKNEVTGFDNFKAEKAIHQHISPPRRLPLSSF